MAKQFKLMPYISAVSHFWCPIVEYKIICQEIKTELIQLVDLGKYPDIKFGLEYNMQALDFLTCCMVYTDVNAGS